MAPKEHEFDGPKRPLNLEIAAALEGFFYTDNLDRYLRLSPLDAQNEEPQAEVLLAETFPVDKKYIREILRPRAGKQGRKNDSLPYIDWRRGDILRNINFPPELPVTYHACIFNNLGEVMREYSNVSEVTGEFYGR